MKKVISLILLCSLLILSLPIFGENSTDSQEEVPEPSTESEQAPASSEEAESEPSESKEEPQKQPVVFEPEEKFSAYLVGDYATGIIMKAENTDTSIPVAGLTQIMTYLVVMDEIRLIKNKGLTDSFVIDANAKMNTPNSIGLDSSQTYTIDELLQSMIVFSADDAAKALALHFGVTEERFVKKMNRKAKQLGLTNTTYYNATGYAKGSLQNQSTARDQFTLLRHVLRKYPILLDYGEVTDYSLPTGELVNSPMRYLMRYIPDLDVLKVGYSDKLGYSFAGTFLLKEPTTSSRILFFFFGASSRDSLSNNGKKLVEFVKNNFTEEKIKTLPSASPKADPTVGRDMKSKLANRIPVNFIELRSYILKP